MDWFGGGGLIVAAGDTMETVANGGTMTVVESGGSAQITGGFGEVVQPPPEDVGQFYPPKSAAWGSLHWLQSAQSGAVYPARWRGDHWLVLGRSGSLVIMLEHAGVWAWHSANSEPSPRHETLAERCERLRFEAWFDDRQAELANTPMPLLEAAILARRAAEASGVAAKPEPGKDDDAAALAAARPGAALSVSADIIGTLDDNLLKRRKRQMISLTIGAIAIVAAVALVRFYE